jgi:hypothetical protein
VLRRYAPRWLAQLPELVSESELERLHGRLYGTTPARMLRELAEALEGLTAERVLVLVLLHQRIGARLEGGYGAQAGEITTQLAVHFERGGKMQRAVHYLVWSKNSNALFSQCLRANHSQFLALQSTVL